MRKMFLAATTLPVPDPAAFLHIAASAGYTGVGLRLYQAAGGANALASNPTLRKQIKSMLTETGLAVLDVFSCYLRAEPDFDGLRPALECGAELGAKYALAICADSERPRLVDSLAQLCAFTSEYGLLAAVEAPLHERTIPTIDETLRLIDDAGGAAVVCLDTYQIYRTGEALTAAQRQPDRFPYLQLADGFASPVATRLSGDGAVPLREIVDQLPTSMPISVECVPSVDQLSDPLAWAEAVLAAARAALSV